MAGHGRSPWFVIPPSSTANRASPDATSSRGATLMVAPAIAASAGSRAVAANVAGRPVVSVSACSARSRLSVASCCRRTRSICPRRRGWCCCCCRRPPLRGPPSTWLCNHGLVIGTSELSVARVAMFGTENETTDPRVREWSYFDWTNRLARNRFRNNEHLSREAGSPGGWSGASGVRV